MTHAWKDTAYRGRDAMLPGDIAFPVRKWEMVRKGILEMIKLQGPQSVTHF